MTNGKKRQKMELIAELSNLQNDFEQLRETNQFLNSVVQNIPIMVFVKDAMELRFVFVNKKLEEFLGYSTEQLIGKTDYDVFPKDEADFFTSKDREVLASHTLLDIAEEPIQTKNRGIRILHTKKITILGNDGNPTYLLGITEDITEKREAEERIRTLHDLLPICATCKKIRDDEGYWQQLESYLSDNADIRFTHGLCPTCYEEYRKKIENYIGN